MKMYAASPSTIGPIKPTPIGAGVDIIRRYLEYRSFEVRHVVNFTDVDDKIINRANQLGRDQKNWPVVRDRVHGRPEGAEC